MERCLNEEDGDFISILVSMFSFLIVNCFELHKI